MAEMTLELLGELVIGLRDDVREVRAVQQTIVGMLRRIEDRLDRQDELIMSLLQSDRDMERRLRVLERASQPQG